MLRKEPGILKLFTLFKDKYRSIGRVGGTVSISGFSQAETESIAGFLGASADKLLVKGRVSLTDYEKAMKTNIFSDYTLVGLLEEVLGESIITRREESDMYQKQENDFFQSLINDYPGGRWWWEWIQAKSTDTRWIWSLYREASDSLREELVSVYNAYRQLPSARQFERLPLFSQRMTGNPHYFDIGGVSGKLLLHCLYVDQYLKGNRTEGMPKTSEEVNELLGQYMLMRDDLWSFVTCRGFLAESDSGAHPVWKAAAETDSVLNVPIKELVKLKKIWPVHGEVVWVVENSGVCSTILDYAAAAPVVCTHGQFRTASWVMLDLIVQSGFTLRYSGDLDPEGLLMAQRLKDRYQDRVSFWRMDKSSYISSISEEDISGRLSKLAALTSPELKEIAEIMKIRKKAGYQEALIAELVQDIEGQGDGYIVPLSPSSQF
nr:TIGR02679 family protein [Metabacillus lacus]